MSLRKAQSLYTKIWCHAAMNDVLNARRERARRHGRTAEVCLRRMCAKSTGQQEQRNAELNLILAAAFSRPENLNPSFPGFGRVVQKYRYARFPDALYSVWRADIWNW